MTDNRLQPLSRVLCALLVICGCSASPKSDAQQGGPGATGANNNNTQINRNPFPFALGFPRFGDSGVVRSTSGATPIEGIDFIAEMGVGNGIGTLPFSHAVRTDPDSDFAWVMYGVTGLLESRPVRLDTTITPATIAPGGDDLLPLKYWIGLSNYTTSSWEFRGPFEEAQQLVLNGQEICERYVSAIGMFSFILLADATGIAPGVGNPNGLCGFEIESSSLSDTAVSDPGYFQTKPHFTALDEVKVGSRTASALPEPTQVTLNWVHVSDPHNNAMNEAFIYQVFRQKEGEGKVPIGSVLAPQETYTDPSDNAPGRPPLVPGEKYTYSLRAVNPKGYTRFSSRDPQAVHGFKQIEIFESSALGVAELSLAVIGSKPAVAFIDTQSLTVEDQTSALMYAKSTSSDGAKPGDWKTVRVPTTGTPDMPSLAEIGANPAIAYHCIGLGGNPTAGLWYARSSTPAGTAAADWTSVQLSTGDVAGVYPSLCSVDSQPAIAFCDFGDIVSSFNYWRASVGTGMNPSDWTSRLELAEIDISVLPHSRSYLRELDGKPLAALGSGWIWLTSSTATGGTLADWTQFAADCGSWRMNIDNISFPAEAGVARLVGENALFYTGNRDLYYRLMSWDDSQPSVDIGPQLFSESPYDPTLCVINGNPVLGYAVQYEDGGQTQARLILAFSSTSTGENPSDWEEMILDTGGPARFWGFDMAEVNGDLGLVYCLKPNTVKYVIWQ